MLPAHGSPTATMPPSSPAGQPGGGIEIGDAAEIAAAAAAAAGAHVVGAGRRQRDGTSCRALGITAAVALPVDSVAPAPSMATTVMSTVACTSRSKTRAKV